MGTEPRTEAPQGTRLVLMSENLLESIGTRDADGRRLTFEWGEPDEHGWYTPTITTHEPGLIEEAIAGVERLVPATGMSHGPLPGGALVTKSAVVACLRGLQESR